MLDRKVAEAVLKGRVARNDAGRADTDPDKPSISKFKEGKRLQEELPKNGFDLDKVRSTPRTV